MTTKPRPKKAIHARLDFDTMQRINALCSLTGESKSQVVRILIKKALQGTVQTNQTNL